MIKVETWKKYLIFLAFTLGICYDKKIVRFIFEVIMYALFGHKFILSIIYSVNFIHAYKPNQDSKLPRCHATDETLKWNPSSSSEFAARLHFDSTSGSLEARQGHIPGISLKPCQQPLPLPGRISLRETQRTNATEVGTHELSKN